MARVEFLAVAAYYEQIERGLGVRFTRAVEAAVALAAELPGAGSTWKHGTRRVFTKNYPFSIACRVGKTLSSSSRLRIFAESQITGTLSEWTCSALCRITNMKFTNPRAY